MTVIELLNGLISDINDYIDDYKYDIKVADSRLLKKDREIRIDELKKWRIVLKTILSEQE
jgi:hypothetical protein